MWNIAFVKLSSDARTPYGAQRRPIRRSMSTFACASASSNKGTNEGGKLYNPWSTTTSLSGARAFSGGGDITVALGVCWR